jgi:TolB-like protein
MSFIDELKRRNVFRVGAAYVVVAWLLLQVADVVLNNIEAPIWVFQAIILVLAIGFPLALFFAWAFEITPEGVKKEKDVDRSQSITHATGRKLDFAIIGVLAIAVVYFVTDKFYLTDETEPEVGSTVAVLPFVPLSSGEDDGYFADGLTEEILNALAQLPELQVTARTSSFFFKGQNIPVPEIAARLKVGHVVEGTVRREGQRLRITAQLIRASDGFDLWSQTYDRTLDDVFAVQEDIAENIAAALNVVLDDNAWRLMRRVGIRDVEAFIAYQKGLEAYGTAHQGGGSMSEALAIANVYFDRALEATPDLTTARLMKADLAGHIIHEIAVGLHNEEYPEQAQDVLAALQEEYNLALQLSPPGNRRDILDLERTLFSGDWSRLPAQIQKAMQPGGCPQMNWTNPLLAPFGWAEQTAEKLREILECDPMDTNASFHLPWSLIFAGEPEAALRSIEGAENKGISHPWLEDLRYWALLAAGRANEALARGPGPKGSMMLYPRQILGEALAGNPEVARQMAEGYWSEPDADDWNSLIIAAVVGDRNRANEIAARIDTYPGSPVAFTVVIFTCFCGAPFDLEVAPNYKDRLEEAGFPWPPPTGIDFPTKTW